MSDDDLLKIGAMMDSDVWAEEVVATADVVDTQDKDESFKPVEQEEYLVEIAENQDRHEDENEAKEQDDDDDDDDDDGSVTAERVLDACEELQQCQAVSPLLRLELAQAHIR